MLCVILRVWEKWAAVVDSKLLCVTARKDRAISLWKAADARLDRVPIERFVFLTFLDRRIELIQSEELIGRGKTYQTAMRSSAKVSEDDKDEIARAIELVRSAEWAQLPPKFKAYEDASRAWSKARAFYMEATSAAMLARIAAAAAAASVAKSRREGNVLKAKVTKERAARLADRADRWTCRADVARDAELRATAALHTATAAHLESKLWETRELVAYRARIAVAQMSAARKRARARGKKPDAKAEAQFAQSVEEAETLMLQLRDEDDASRGFRSLGPVWRGFNM
jgi:hypothetical protein